VDVVLNGVHVAASSEPLSAIVALVSLRSSSLGISADACDVEGVHQEVGLDVEVEGRVCRETRGEVDFEEVGFELGVEEDIESEQLEAVMLLVGCSSLAVALLEVAFDGENGLDDQVVDAFPDGLHIDA
jgi:hypothetical protein